MKTKQLTKQFQSILGEIADISVKSTDLETFEACASTLTSNASNAELDGPIVSYDMQ